MKCPYCGAETKEGKTCGGCGKELPPRRVLEVEYKDFKVSEMLDIKLGNRTPGAENKPQPRASEEKEPGTPSPFDKKSVFAAGAVVLAIAAVVFFLLKFVFKL